MCSAKLYEKRFATQSVQQSLHKVLVVDSFTRQLVPEVTYHVLVYHFDHVVCLRIIVEYGLHICHDTHA